MTGELNEFGRTLVALISLYLTYYFGHILWVKGGKWVLAKYLLAGILIFGAVAFQSWYAALTRHFGNGSEYHPTLDHWRDYVNFFYAVPFIIGAYIYESETREIKKHGKMTLIYLGAILLSAWVVWG